MLKMIALAGLLLAPQDSDPFPFGAQAEARAEERELEAALRERSRSFSRAYMEGDIEALLDHYTQDGVAMPGARDPIVGQDALRTYWTLPEGSRVTAHMMIPDAIIFDDIWAFDRGVYHGTIARDGVETGFSGRYFVVWKEEGDGQWRMAHDMWAAFD